MAWVEILPGYTSLFRGRRWDSASSFLSWTGFLVNKHRNRQVEQVSFEPTLPLDCASGSVKFFLKKEFAVTWRDRFRNAWHGFGWCSTAVREGAMLQALREAGIGCPEAVALGEDQRQAFVLMRDESDMTELRAFLQHASSEERHRLAEVLGRELAKLHDAGFDHPDLFAKHILVAPRGATFRICILDWQRGRHRPAVSWRLRCRDLAALDATLHEALASDRLRLRCLGAYLRSARDRRPLRRLAVQIRAHSRRLRGNRNIRECGQLPTPARDQQFVSLRDGQLLVVRSYHEKLGGRLPEWMTQLSEREGEPLACASGSERLLYRSWAGVASMWDIPPLAHTLFRLQRFGVPAPRLLTVGRSASRIFLVAETVATIPFEQAFAKTASSCRSRLLHQAGAIVRQLHEAGYHLAEGDSWVRRLGVNPATGVVYLANVESLPRDATPWQERAPTELDHQRIQLSRTDQLRFLNGYLRRRERQTPSGIQGKPSIEARERQAVS